MSEEKRLAEMETFFLALADKTRLRLLNLMRDGEICVCFLVEVLGESQPKISRHLAYLRGAGVVEARRDGKWMHYKIVEPESDFAALLLQDTLDWLKSQDDMRGEYRKLAEVCCSPNELITISRAPKPKTFVETNASEIQHQELETFLL
jgi:ArsR family transcriptional regulator